MSQKKVRFGKHHLPLPASRIARIALGAPLILGGIVGFLPIVGFWMIPLGVLVLSYDIAVVRRARRRLWAWWRRRFGPPRGNGKRAGGSRAPEGAENPASIREDPRK